NTELERTGDEEGFEVVADARRPLADLEGPAVEGTGDRIPVNVEGARMATGHQPVGAHRLGQEFAPFVATDDGGADIEVVVLRMAPLRRGAQPMGDEGPVWPFPMPVPRHEDPAPAGPVAFVEYAMTGGDHQALVGGDHRGPRASAVAAGFPDEDSAVDRKA